MAEAPPCPQTPALGTGVAAAGLIWGIVTGVQALTNASWQNQQAP